MELLPMLLLFGLLGVMMYFMSRRQRRAQEQQMQLQSSLAVGDRVMTTSGLYGTITDTSDDATVTVEIAPGVETEWLRAAVREKVGPVAEDEELVEDDELEVVEETPDAEIRDSEIRDVEVRDETKDTASSLETGKQK